MFQKSICIIFVVLAKNMLFAQPSKIDSSIITYNSSVSDIKFFQEKKGIQFSLTAEFLDAAINSINSFNSLIKKENYRVKITSFNNPTSSEMGFNLENEIHSALKPLLAKAKNTNTNKFSQVVTSLISGQSKATPIKAVTNGVNPLLSTLLSLVGTLTIQEKKITRDDLDSFVLATSKYFVQYEKLNQANILFDQNIEKINNKLKDLQFDIKEYILDIITILNKNVQRDQLKTTNTEQLFLKYLDKEKLQYLPLDDSEQKENSFRYPTDGIKTAKDIAYNLQKLFNEYQKVYGDNYMQIRSILLESKSLGKNINTKQIENSLKELEELYNESKLSDNSGLRLTTLFERLKTLVATDQISVK